MRKRYLRLALNQLPLSATAATLVHRHHSRPTGSAASLSWEPVSDSSNSSHKSSRADTETSSLGDRQDTVLTCIQTHSRHKHTQMHNHTNGTYTYAQSHKWHMHTHTHLHHAASTRMLYPYAERDRSLAQPAEAAPGTKQG